MALKMKNKLDRNKDTLDTAEEKICELEETATEPT